MVREKSRLSQLPTNKIRKNKDNPRIIFRESDMQRLFESISEGGIRVPITVYEDGKKFILIDGERRWRCASRLNFLNIPAIIQPKPSRVENILIMFNIHNVRQDWDLMPMALKLNELRDLLEKSGKSFNSRAIAGVTGLSPTAVDRAFQLLDLPKKYTNRLMREAAKPKSEQVITADLIFEINKSYRAIARYLPIITRKINKYDYLDIMIRKYEKGVVNNVVRFRDISKIARAERVGGQKTLVIPVIRKLISNHNFTIEDAYTATVELVYQLRDVNTKTKSLVVQLSQLKKSHKITSEIASSLQALRLHINRLIGSDE